MKEVRSGYFPHYDTIMIRVHEISMRETRSR